MTTVSGLDPNGWRRGNILWTRDQVKDLLSQLEFMGRMGRITALEYRPGEHGRPHGWCILEYRSRLNRGAEA